MFYKILPNDLYSPLLNFSISYFVRNTYNFAGRAATTALDTSLPVQDGHGHQTGCHIWLAKCFQMVQPLQLILSYAAYMASIFLLPTAAVLVWYFSFFICALTSLFPIFFCAIQIFSTFSWLGLWPNAASICWCINFLTQFVLLLGCFLLRILTRKQYFFPCTIPYYSIFITILSCTIVFSIAAITAKCCTSCMMVFKVISHVGFSGSQLCLTLMVLFFELISIVPSAVPCALQSVHSVLS